MPRRAGRSETGTCPNGQRQGCRWRAEGQEDPSASPGLRPGSAGSQRHRGGVSLGTFFGRAKKVPRPPVREPALKPRAQRTKTIKPCTHQKPKNQATNTKNSKLRSILAPWIPAIPAGMTASVQLIPVAMTTLIKAIITNPVQQSSKSH